MGGFKVRCRCWCDPRCHPNDPILMRDQPGVIHWSNTWLWNPADPTRSKSWSGVILILIPVLVSRSRMDHTWLDLILTGKFSWNFFCKYLSNVQFKWHFSNLWWLILVYIMQIKCLWIFVVLKRLYRWIWNFDPKPIPRDRNEYGFKVRCWCQLKLEYILR